MKKIKLVVSDFDGTLLRTDRTLSKRTLLIAEKCRKAGVIFTIATGRMYRTIAPFAEAMGVTAPVIAYNGALVACSQKTLFARYIESNTAKNILDIFHARGWNLLSFADDELQVDKLLPVVQEYYVKSLKLPVTETGEIFWREYRPTLKYLSCVLSQRHADEIAVELRTFLGNKVSFVYTYPHFQIMAPDVNKSLGLRNVADYYGIELSETAVFGDEANDMEMIADVAQGYVVSNAAPALRAICRNVVGSNDADGVAEKIDELLACKACGDN